MKSLALPKRTGPRQGANAFDLEGEQQIYDAVKRKDAPMSPLQVAFEVGTSVQTIYSIIKRVETRQKEESRPSDTGTG